MLVINLLQTVLNVRNPAARLQARHRLLRLDLVARVAERRERSELVLRLHVELAEHLAVRLNKLPVKEKLLPVVPASLGIEIVRMRHAELRVSGKFARLAVYRNERRSLQHAGALAVRVDKSPHDGRDNRIGHQRFKLSRRKLGHILHRLLEHQPRAAVLLGERLLRLRERENKFVLLVFGRYGLEFLAALGALDLAFSLLVDHEAQGDIVERLRLGQLADIVEHHRLHAHGQAGHVGKSCIFREIAKSHVHSRVLTCLALRAELGALLAELHVELVPVQHVLITRKRDQCRCHQRVLVALLMDLLLRVGERQFAAGRVGVLPGTRMLRAVGDVLRRVVDHFKALLPDRFEGLAEPVEIERAVVELLGRDRCVFCEKSLLLLGKTLVHMRNEIIACGFKALPAEVLSDHGDPSLGVKRCLHKTLVRNIGSLEPRAQLLRGVILARHAHRQQMRETLALGHIIAEPCRALQRVASERGKDLNEPVHAEDTAYAPDLLCELGRGIPAAKLTVKDEPDQLLIDPRCVLDKRKICIRDHGIVL